MTRALVLACALPVLALAEGKPSITWISRGAAVQPPADSALPVEIVVTELPNAPPKARNPALAQVDESIALARKLYLNASFARCLEKVDDDALVRSALAEGNRLAAARMLLWRTACFVGSSQQEPASRAAAAFAAYQLDIPPDIASTTPEVEQALAAA